MFHLQCSSCFSPTLATLVLTWFAASCAFAAKPPAVTDGAPAAGMRVRVTAPDTGYDDNDNIYHTLYLPTDWKRTGKYPIIVEFAPNTYGSFSGAVDDTRLGYYQSGGVNYIWISVPSINWNKTLEDTSDDKQAAWWWGIHENDRIGMKLTAKYTLAAVLDTIRNYGGKHDEVFVTGFSRGAIATGAIANFDDSIADVWLGYLPHSHHDGFMPIRELKKKDRIDRIAGRASFISYGEADGGGKGSAQAAKYLVDKGYPVEQHRITGLGHTDSWITDTKGSVSSTQGSKDVRADLRRWLAKTRANRPGTSSISGIVTNAEGMPLSKVKIQSGLTHWTFTDAKGKYLLKGLIDGSDGVRVVSAALEGHAFTDRTVRLAGKDKKNLDFEAASSVPQ